MRHGHRAGRCRDCLVEIGRPGTAQYYFCLPALVSSHLPLVATLSTAHHQSSPFHAAPVGVAIWHDLCVALFTDPALAISETGWPGRAGRCDPGGLISWIDFRHQRKDDGRLIHAGSPRLQKRHERSILHHISRGRPSHPPFPEVFPSAANIAS